MPLSCIFKTWISLQKPTVPGKFIILKRAPQEDKEKESSHYKTHKKNSPAAILSHFSLQLLPKGTRNAVHKSEVYFQKAESE